MNGLPPAAVTSVTTYYDTGSPRLLSADRRSTQVLISLAGTDYDARSAAYAEIKDELEPQPYGKGIHYRTLCKFSVGNDCHMYTTTGGTIHLWRRRRSIYPMTLRPPSSARQPSRAFPKPRSSASPSVRWSAMPDLARAAACSPAAGQLLGRLTSC